MPLPHIHQNNLPHLNVRRVNANAGRLLTPDERLLVEEVKLYAYTLKDEKLRNTYLDALELPRAPTHLGTAPSKPIGPA